MRYSSVTAIAALAAVSYASPVRWAAPSSAAASSAAAYPTEAAGGSTTPFEYPLSNGFPSTNLSKDAIKSIEEQAHGTLPNGPPPAALASDTITSLELIAFNENFEVAFFTDLLYNITNKVQGYEVSNQADYEQLVSAITAVQAQEQLHSLNANGAVAHFGHPPIGGCSYNFPATNLQEALSLAKLFTDVVLGTLANIQGHAAVASDAGLVPAIGAVIGQEGEQNGYYRAALDLDPSALPFLTASSRAFAFSALNQVFVVPGSCDAAVQQINLPIFAPLTVSPAAPAAQDQTLTFTPGSGADASNAKAIVYINQQNTPVVMNLTAPTNGAYSVNFPYTEYEMNGLTIVALTNSTGPFASADDVAAATIAGPALIEIN